MPPKAAMERLWPSDTPMHLKATEDSGVESWRREAVMMDAEAEPCASNYNIDGLLAINLLAT